MMDGDRLVDSWLDQNLLGGRHNILCVFMVVLVFTVYCL
jgi:hypothetical protein